STKCTRAGGNEGESRWFLDGRNEIASVQLTDTRRRTGQKRSSSSPVSSENFVAKTVAQYAPDSLVLLDYGYLAHPCFFHHESRGDIPRVTLRVYAHHRELTECKLNQRPGYFGRITVALVFRVDGVSNTSHAWSLHVVLE